MNEHTHSTQLLQTKLHSIILNKNHNVHHLISLLSMIFGKHFVCGQLQYAWNKLHEFNIKNVHQYVCECVYVW